MIVLPQSLRITIFSVAALMLILTGDYQQICASELRPVNDAERFALEQVRRGESADLEQRFPKKEFPDNEFPDARALRGSFVAKLLTLNDRQSRPERKVSIENATIAGDVSLNNQEVLSEVYLFGCTINGNVNFRNTHFAKGLEMHNTAFEGFVDLTGATIADNFGTSGCRFAGFANLDNLRVGRDLTFYASTFDTSIISFEGARVGGAFSIDGSDFLTRFVTFKDLQVEREFSARNCSFVFKENPADEGSMLVQPEKNRESSVSFSGAHFDDLFLNETVFESISTIDFTRMKANFMSFDGVKILTPSKINLRRMTFKLVSPVNADKLMFLFSDYDAIFYADLETSLRTHGYLDEADKIFIAKKRIERRQRCESFRHRCERTAWALSLFQDLLTGYGKRLQYLLGWSLGFLVIGIFVFRSEKGMRTKDRKDAPQFAGEYNAFWYSLDLFLPIIKLGVAETWTPKDNRRWANLYKKVHIIIGSLFVPIGLAALTGIIR